MMVTLAQCQSTEKVIQMVKENTKSAAPVAAPAKQEKPKVLVVKAGVKYRGAREAWYARLQEFNGKSAEAFLESCEKKHPSVPKSGRPEAPAGWLRFFQRTGVVHQVEAK